jgi:hypothetical protein
MNPTESAEYAATLELLPAYVNGTASEHERVRVKSALARDAQVRAALAWHESLADKVMADVDAAPDDVGWAQLQARVRAASNQRRVRTPPIERRAGLGHWLASWLPHHWIPAPVLGGACAALLAVVVGQGLYLGQGSTEPDYASVRGVAPEEGGAGNAAEALARAQGLGDSRFVQLNFKEQVSERDMRLMLVRSGAVIVDGPGQLGDYTVAVPAGEVQQALTAFKDSLLTESVQDVAAPVARASVAGASSGAAPGAALTRPVP